MIEAVNTVVSNASNLRVVAEQASVARIQSQPAPSADVAAAVVELPKAPYISPYISMDLNYDKAVLQIRDSDTGDVVQQFPTESRLAEIRRASAVQERASQIRFEEQQQDLPDPVPVQTHAAAPQRPLPQIKSDVIVTVQEVTSTQPANVSVAPQVAAAALSAGAQSSAVSASASVSVLA